MLFQQNTVDGMMEIFYKTMEKHLPKVVEVRFPRNESAVAHKVDQRPNEALLVSERQIMAGFKEVIRFLCTTPKVRKSPDHQIWEGCGVTTDWKYFFIP